MALVNKVCKKKIAASLHIAHLECGGCVWICLFAGYAHVGCN